MGGTASHDAAAEAGDIAAELGETVSLGPPSLEAQAAVQATEAAMGLEYDMLR